MTGKGNSRSPSEMTNKKSNSNKKSNRNNKDNGNNKGNGRFLRDDKQEKRQQQRQIGLVAGGGFVAYFEVTDEEEYGDG
jgi:hypothetical protein